MKNKIWILIFFILLIVIAFTTYYFKNKYDNENNQYKSNYASNKVSFESQNLENDDIYDKTNVNNRTSEEELSVFSTKIYTKEYARQNNVTITCSKLNETIIKKGETFSFCDTVGKATTSEGYKKADIFDKNGKKIKGLGGGNCQVSTTLYNAVSLIPNISIIERHEHSNKVPYIETGKDAAVAFGSYDFKFRNNTKYDLKIRAWNTPDNINMSILKII